MTTCRRTRTRCRLSLRAISTALLSTVLAVTTLTLPFGCASSSSNGGSTSRGVERSMLSGQPIAEGVPISIQFTPDKVEFLPTDGPQKTVTATVQLNNVAQIGTKFTIEAIAFVSDENDQGQAVINNQEVEPDVVSTIDEHVMTADSDSFTFEVTVKHNIGTDDDVTVMIIVMTEDETKFALNTFEVIQLEDPPNNNQE